MGIGTPAFTDDTGLALLGVHPRTRPHTPLRLQLLEPDDLAFISPWNNTIVIPPFDNQPTSVAEVVLCSRTCRAALEREFTTAAIAARINASGTDAPDGNIVGARNAALRRVSAQYGLDPADVDEAIHNLGARADDAFARGVALLYGRHYPDAIGVLNNASSPERHGRADALFFLGQAFMESNKPADAVAALEAANEAQPGDPATLTNLGISLMRSGNALRADQVLRESAAISIRRGGVM